VIGYLLGCSLVVGGFAFYAALGLWDERTAELTADRMRRAYGQDSRDAGDVLQEAS
jgi:hypothetical protein